MTSPASLVSARVNLARAAATLAAVVYAAVVPHAALAQSSATAGVADDVKACAVCHGADGNSRLPNVPSLAGQPEFFILNQLILMREGVRRIDVMTPVVRTLTDERIEALARHFASQAPRASDESVDPALSDRGAALATKLRCGSCHRADLAGQDQMPRLAKQRIDYLIWSMQALRDDKRIGADTLMTAAIRGVSDADLSALAHYATSR